MREKHAHFLLDAYVDRAKQLVHRDKLHCSVVIWSLGNEAFYAQGGNHTAMRDWIKEYDPTRPVHYEPDLEAHDMDMHSRMYPNISEIIEFGKDPSKKKPLVLCEYIHAMGTGPGNIKEYIDAFYQYEKLQGGWVWEWANHGLLTKTKDRKPYYGYGGDFGDVPNDYNFVMDGVLNSDHSPRSALIEYKKAVEPVQAVQRSGANSLKIINRLDFDTLDHLQCTVAVVDEDGSRDLGAVAIPSGIQPGATAEIEFPKLSPNPTKETFLDFSFKLKDKTTWAAKGHEVALIQVPIKSPSQIVEEQKDNSPVKAKATGTILSIDGGNCQWEIDTVRGKLRSWSKDGKSLISQPLEPSFYRAPTDNDAPRDGRDWKDRVLNLAKIGTRSVEWHQNDDGTASVVMDQKFAPPVLSWSLDLETEYTFTTSGAVRINVKGTPKGQNLPKTLPRIGVTLGLPQEFQQIEWFGRGPGESYKDMKLSQRVATHSVSTVDKLWANPDFPQECSNRTNTRWLKISSPNAQLIAQFLKSEDSYDRHLFDFMASHYDVQDIDKAQHPFELEEKKQKDVILRLDADHHGLGKYRNDLNV